MALEGSLNQAIAYESPAHSSTGTRSEPRALPTALELIIACGFSSTPTSPFPYHWEVDSPNTYHTLLECQVIVWWCWEVLEEAKDGRCNMELVAGSGELDKTRFREALLEEEFRGFRYSG